MLGGSSSTRAPFGGQTLWARAPKWKDVGSPVAVPRGGRTLQGTVHWEPGMEPGPHALHQPHIHRRPAPLEAAV